MELSPHALPRLGKLMAHLRPWGFVACAIAGLSALPPSSDAQTLSDRFSHQVGPSSNQKEKDRLLVQANEMVYDRDKNIVLASGDVQLYYQGKVLQADKVIYDRSKNRVYAEGHAKMTEKDGTVSYGDKFELTDDFKDGFINSLRADSTDRTHFTAARSERVEGDTTVFDRGTYTACPACEKNPDHPPLWQVRSKRIIHKNEEQTVYFEDAYLELWGMPVAYLPYFSMPDPSVKRKTGFLMPSYTVQSNLGVGIRAPFYWAIDPHYDLTITPTIYTNQGFFGELEWRHRLENGYYNLKMSGISELNPNSFNTAPYGPGSMKNRGSVESNGFIDITDKWRFGWNIALLSDKWFLDNYKEKDYSLSSNYFRELTSTIFLTGQADKGYFDIRGYHFFALSPYDQQQQQPLVGPDISYNKAVSLAPEQSFGLGGQLDIDANMATIVREMASYQSVGGRLLDNTYHLYDVCSVYDKTHCLLRGIGGDYTRATLNVSWKRQYIDPMGQVWTPFTFAHLNASWLDMDKTNSLNVYNASGGIITNSAQAAFIDGSNQSYNGQFVPGVGTEYRYPFMARFGASTHVVEPIAQIIVRPDEPTVRANEDAQSLVFDDTNLFEWNKFSGYDRFEGGTRANVGGQYTLTFDKGAYANLLFGQSFQLAGRNSYATPDAANTGLSSGLDSARSDYITRLQVAPTTNWTFIAKGRFDPTDYYLRRLDLSTSAQFGQWTTSVLYARYEAQPLLGFDKRREGIATSASYRINKNYSVNGNVIFDMTRHLYNNDTNVSSGGHAAVLSPAGIGFGGTYQDDCTTVSLNYLSVLQNTALGTNVRNNTLLLQISLRTLGDIRTTTSLGMTASDGIKPSYP
jgi:LPS-assembly protein